MPESSRIYLKADLSVWAVVDPELYSRLAQYRWHLHCPKPGRRYAARRVWVDGVRRRVYLHQEVMRLLGRPAPQSYRRQVIDHGSGDGLDNRGGNLSWKDHEGNHYGGRRPR